MGLFSPIWMTENRKNVDRAIAAVNKMSDPAKLAKVALNAHFAPIVIAACERIDDKDVLAQAGCRSGSDVAMAVVDKLEGRDDLLLKVARAYPFASCAALLEPAIDKLREPDPAALAKLRNAMAQQRLSAERDGSWQESSAEGYRRVMDAFGRAIARRGGGSQAMADAMRMIAKEPWESHAWMPVLGRLDESELEQLAESPDVALAVRQAACEKANHDLDEHCNCRRCGKEHAHALEHDICTLCGGRQVVETNDLIEKRGVAEPVKYGVNRNTYMVYPDGTRVLEHHEKAIDRGMWNYLYGD